MHQAWASSRPAGERDWSSNYFEVVSHTAAGTAGPVARPAGEIFTWRTAISCCTFTLSSFTSASLTSPAVAGQISLNCYHRLFTLNFSCFTVVFLTGGAGREGLSRTSGHCTKQGSRKIKPVAGFPKAFNPPLPVIVSVGYILPCATPTNTCISFYQSISLARTSQAAADHQQQEYLPAMNPAWKSLSLLLRVIVDGSSPVKNALARIFLDGNTFVRLYWYPAVPQFVAAK